MFDANDTMETAPGSPAPVIRSVLEVSRRVGFVAGVFSALALAFRGHALAAPYALVGALGVYLLLPWRSRRPDEAVYSLLLASVLPDLLGTLLASLFFAIPLFVIPGAARAGAGLFDVEDGWIWLTVIGWGFALSALSIPLAALHYAVFSIRILPDRLRIRSLLRERDWALGDITACEVAVPVPPRWLRILLVAGAVLKPRLAGPLLAPVLAGAAQASGITLRHRDGRAIRLWTGYLIGAPMIVAALRAAGIAMPPGIPDLVGESKGPAAAPGTARRILPISLFALLGAVILFLANRPPPPPAVPRPEPAPISAEAALERRRILAEMKAVREEMDAAVERLRKASAQDRPAALGAFQAASERFHALHRRFEEAGRPAGEDRGP